MTEFISIAVNETDVLDSFTVSKEFIEQWQVGCDNVDTHVTTDKEVQDFEALVDVVYATLTHEQKQGLFAEALECFNETLKVNPDPGYCYEVSARNYLLMVMACSLSDHCFELVV